jgi:putative transposase
LQPLEVAHYGVNRHHAGFCKGIAFGHQTGQSRACDDLPASLVRRHDNGVFSWPTKAPPRRNNVAHTYTNLLIDGLFSTKGRRPELDAELRPDLFAYMGGIISKLRGRPLLINGPKDHVHLSFVLPASLALSDLMEKVKANSSRWVHERWPRRSLFGWQEGYTAFSVSQSNLEKVKKYIAEQEEHHRKLSFREEVLALLEKHGIEYNPRYLEE